MMSLCYVSKHDRRGSIQQIDTTEMKNINTKHQSKEWHKDIQGWENPIIPKILESRRWTCTLHYFFSARTKSKQDYELIRWNVSKLPSVDILVMANVFIHAIVPTIENYENRTFNTISFRYNYVLQSTVTNNNSVQQTVIDLAPMMPNSRITLFLCSNIQGNLTIEFLA